MAFGLNAKTKETTKRHPAEGPSLFPDYRDCDEQTQFRVDEIIAGIDTTDFRQAMNFGSLACADFRKVTDEIAADLRANMFQDFYESMAQSMKVVKEDRSRTLQERLLNLTSEDKNLGLSLTEQFGVAVGASWAIERKKKALEKKKEEERKELDAIENQLHGEIIAYKCQIRNLEIMKMKIPGLEKRFQRLCNLREESYKKLLLDVIAAGEIERRLKEEISGLVKNADTAEEADSKKTFLFTLNTTLAVLQQSIAANVQSQSGIRQLSDTLDQIRKSLDFLLEKEIPLMMEQIALSERSRNILRTSRMVKTWQDSLETKQEAVLQASEALKRRVEDKETPPDPERVKSMLKGLQDSKDEVDRRAAELQSYRESLTRQTENLGRDMRSFAIKQAQTYAAWVNQERESFNEGKVLVNSAPSPAMPK